MFEEVNEEVMKIMCNDDSGHGMDHINRVYKLATSIAKEEGYDEYVAGLIALLHDVDDYKLFGQANADELVNAKFVMKKCNISEDIQKVVLNELKTIGFSKCLKGIRPKTKEGMAVSDADMCDALGSIGIARVITYGNKISRPLFDRKIFPNLVDSCEYHMITSGSTINFMFEVLLKYKDLMMTSSGKKVAMIRHNQIIDYMRAFFIEEDAPEWIKYLDNYLKKDC